MSWEASPSLVDRLARALSVTGGRRDGDPETRVRLDHLMPSRADGAGTARWRLATTDRRLYPAPVNREALSVWHGADGAKGRRLIARDLVDGPRLAAIASWHFEPTAGARPHLVTSAAAVNDVPDGLAGEYLVALELLLYVVLAIDSRTLGRSAIGLVRDNAIDLSVEQLTDMGFVRAPRRGGYSGDYWWLRLASR